ncbi:hypothetical protein AVEN_242611-1, partial [Araneus ventricosus]
MEDGILGDSIRFCVNQLVFAHQYVFPCTVATMCGVLFKEFSVFLQRFHEHLQDQCLPLSRNTVISAMKLYSSLYELAHELRNATSLICFVLLSCQLSIMYCSIAVFVLAKTENISIPQICENCLVIALVPASILVIVSCASKIGLQHQKIEISLSLLRSKLNL